MELFANSHKQTDREPCLLLIKNQNRSVKPVSVPKSNQRSNSNGIAEWIDRIGVSATEMQYLHIEVNRSWQRLITSSRSWHLMMADRRRKRL